MESNASSSLANMLQMSNVEHCCTAETLQPLIVKTEETRSEADINRQGMRVNSIAVPCASSRIGIRICPRRGCENENPQTTTTGEAIAEDPNKHPGDKRAILTRPATALNERIHEL